MAEPVFTFQLPETDVFLLNLRQNTNYSPIEGPTKLCRYVGLHRWTNLYIDGKTFQKIRIASLDIFQPPQ